MGRERLKFCNCILCGEVGSYVDGHDWKEHIRMANLEKRRNETRENQEERTEKRHEDPSASRFTKVRELGNIVEADGEIASVSTNSTVMQRHIEQDREPSWMTFQPAAPSTHVSQISMPLTAHRTEADVPDLGGGTVRRNRLSNASSVSVHPPSIASSELGAAM